MAEDRLFPNGWDSGWPTGAVANIDEGIASADGLNISTNVDDDSVLLDLTATAVVDADTVTAVDIVVRAKYTGGGDNSIGVEWLVGGSVQGSEQSASLTTSYQNLNISDANWDADWTATQLNGSQIRLYARQTGKPTAYSVEVDAIDLVITYTLAPTGRIMSSLVSAGGLAAAGGIAGPGGGLAG